MWLFKHPYLSKKIQNKYILTLFYFFLFWYYPLKLFYKLTIYCIFLKYIGIDYFQVLVQVFQQVMLSKEHPYLKNFYMIIPALCINYVDTIRVSKDKMDKVKRQGARQTAYFTDDGFAIGIA